MLNIKIYAFILGRMFKRLIYEYNHVQQLYCCLEGIRGLSLNVK